MTVTCYVSCSVAFQQLHTKQVHVASTLATSRVGQIMLNLSPIMLFLLDLPRAHGSQLMHSWPTKSTWTGISHTPGPIRSIWAAAHTLLAYQQHMGRRSYRTHVLLIGQECMSCDPCALGRSSRNSIMGERLSIICPTLLVASVLATCTCFV